MAQLSRLGPALLVTAGAGMTLLLILMAVAPDAPAIYGFFLVAPALGLGVLGVLDRAGGRAGRLTTAAAWLAAAGGVGVVVAGLYAIATDQFVQGATAENDPMIVPFMLTSMSWMLGSVGVAVALVRRGTIGSLGAWLVLGGTASAIGLGTALGSVAPALATLSAVPFALGWAVAGRDLSGRAVLAS